MFPPTVPEIQELLEAFGWKRILSKNEWMVSFYNGGIGKGQRLNLYYTTMTVTIDESGKNCRVYKKANTLEKIEKIITTP